MRLLLPAALALAATAAAAETPTPRFVGSFQDWNVYIADTASGPLCYAASEPKKEEGNYSRRGPAAVIVAKLPGDAPNEQVSVQPGYSFKKDAPAQVTIDGKGFRLAMTQGEHAWTSSAKEDEALIAAMKRGQAMQVRGTSTKDTWSLDSYSLAGFTAAYQAMLDACKRG